MHKALLLPSVFLSIFIVGCDSGKLISSEKMSSKLRVRIERKQEAVRNEKLSIYAMDFQKEGQVLTFVCPCYIAGWPDNWLNVRVEGDSFKLALLPGAEYKVEVQYWAPSADNNTKVQ